MNAALVTEVEKEVKINQNYPQVAQYRHRSYKDEGKDHLNCSW